MIRRCSKVPMNTHRTAPQSRSRRASEGRVRMIVIIVVIMEGDIFSSVRGLARMLGHSPFERRVMDLSCT